MDVTKPYEFIGFGAMDVTKPYEFIGFGAMDVTKPYEFIGFGAPGSSQAPRDQGTPAGIVDVWGLGGPGGPENNARRWGASPPPSGIPEVLRILF